MSWPAGTIVVCVRDGGTAGFSPEPVKDHYYTVREPVVGVCSRTRREAVGVRLNEIVGPMFMGIEEALSSTRFRLAESSHSEAGSVRQQEPVSQ